MRMMTSAEKGRLFGAERGLPDPEAMALTLKKDPESLNHLLRLLLQDHASILGIKIF